MLRNNLRKFIVDNGLLDVWGTTIEPLTRYDNKVSAGEEEIIAMFRHKGIACNLKIVFP